MDALLLQDWITLQGATSVGTLTQPETGWLDMRLYQDVVAWLEVKEFYPTSGNVPTLVYQTSPTKDDALFFAMCSPITLSAGVITTVMLKETMPAGLPPCGRWFRWQIVVSGGVAWNATFRIYVAANRIGGRVAVSDAVTLAALEQEGYQYAYGYAGGVPPAPIYGPQSPPPSGSGVGQGQPVQLQWQPGQPGRPQGPLPTVQGNVGSLGDPSSNPTVAGGSLPKL